jgi:hypothetical protein
MMTPDGTEWADMPVIAVSNPDADHLRRLYAAGNSIRLDLHSTAGWRGESRSGNVVLDLIGREKPEEIVLIGGHLDSWDLGTGAVDDGAGIAITTGSCGFNCTAAPAPAPHYPSCDVWCRRSWVAGCASLR